MHADGVVGWKGVFLVLVASGGLGCIQFYEGVKDFVGKDGMFIVKVVAGCMFNVYVESFYDVKMSPFLLVV